MVSRQSHVLPPNGKLELGDLDSVCTRVDRAAAAVRRLTNRQAAVLSFMVAGCLNKEIASFLGINEKTVKMHRAQLLKRLGVTTSAEGIRIAVEASFARALVSMTFAAQSGGEHAEAAATLPHLRESIGRSRWIEPAS